jgi:hypothetical protein
MVHHIKRTWHNIFSVTWSEDQFQTARQSKDGKVKKLADCYNSLLQNMVLKLEDPS